MRLLLTTDTVGGVWSYSAALANTLAAEGHAVMLAAIGSPTPDQLGLLSTAIELESRQHRLEWMPGGMAEVDATAEWLVELTGRWRATVAHLNQMTYTAARSFGVPTVVVVHSDVCSWFSEVRGSESPPEWEVYRRAVGAGLREAALVVTPSRYQADLVARHFGLADVVVNHNGVAIPPHATRPAARPILVTAGRAWDDAKGIDVLDRALMLLGEDSPEAYLLGATTGPAGEMRALTNIEAVGEVSTPEVDRWLRRAWIYVAPARYEPFGLAVTEAAARGCALVLSDIGSFRELWGGCGRFFPTGDPAGLAQVLRELISEPSKAASLGSAAATRVRERYSIEGTTARYLSLYRRLNEGRSSAAPAVAVHQS